MHIIFHLWQTRKIISNSWVQPEQRSVYWNARVIQEGDGGIDIKQENKDQEINEAGGLGDRGDPINISKGSKHDRYSHRIRPDKDLAMILYFHLNYKKVWLY